MLNKLLNLSFPQRVLWIGIVGNAIWLYVYFQAVLAADWSEKHLVALYMGEKKGSFIFQSYLLDMGFLAFMIFSALHLWKHSKYKNHSFFSDFIRAIIVLFFAVLLVLQPILFMGYLFGPKSW